MTFRTTRQAPSEKPQKAGFRAAEPLAEGQRALPEAEIRQVFVSFFLRKADDMADRFEDARSKLRELFGASVEILETPSGALRLSARLEFLTEDRTLDPNLSHMVAGRGFQLRLFSVPVVSGSSDERYEYRERSDGLGRKVGYYEQRMLRKYIISESEASSKLDRAVQSAEALLELAGRLRPAGLLEDLPTKVVPIESARASRPPPQKAGPQEPRIEASPPAHGAQGGKAS